ncbi:tyrosine-type recombinase/integrase [Deinococcus marmoris]|uniref:Integrase/recombinase XerD n=1 Tax=Deinococcus marmoris TaxID=249408 RepID=A0A1U7P4T8_9DEIO|nr:site-specific integrase [Deinococcus marmoris]OLV20183.1 integrase/recombinase XerD [Deinococcus marmoris]
MSLDLMAARLDLAARSERLARLEPDALRREALRWAAERDEAGLWDLTEAFLVTRGSAGARVSQNTLMSYRAGLSAFLNWAGPGGMSLLRPRPNDGYGYARHLEASGLAPGSVRVRLAAARALFAALRWSGASDAAPLTDVRAAPDPVPAWQKRQPYSKADIELLLRQADPQQKVMVLLGAHCGLRVGEMAGLMRADLHLTAERPYLTVTGKRQKRQEVPVSRRCGVALSRWVEMTPKLGPRVLNWETRKGISDSLRELCKVTGVRYVGREVHGLRHTAGTEVYRQTRDLLEVRDHLRHASVETSSLYVNHARQQDRAVNLDW